VLRLPNSFNHKRGTPVLVQLETFEPSRRYALDALDAALPQDPTTANPAEVSVISRPSAPRSGALHDRLDRGRAYLLAMGPAVEGQSGDAKTYRAACWLTIDLMLDDCDAMALLREWNSTCCPPWTDSELFAKVCHARRYGRHSAGSALTDAFPRYEVVKVQVR
jgi:hypothetical protein